MSLDKEVDVVSGDLVLDEDPAPLQKREAQHPNFRRMSIVAKRLDSPGYHLVRR